MKQFKNISIRKKILISMLVFTLLPIILVAAVATTIPYLTMRDQLIYDHRMSSGWLQDRLSLDVNTILDHFYDFEVDKAVKNDIYQWCVKGEPLNYAAQWQIITLMNTLISMDSSINSIEIHNLSDDSVLIAARSGAHLYIRGDRLDRWFARGTGLQSNLVFLREENGLYRKYQETHYQRAYSLQEIQEALALAGMEFVTAYDAFTKDAPRKESERIYVIAREHGKKQNN